MMFDHGANPIFFNKKSKACTSRSLVNLLLIFVSTPPLPPNPRLLKADVICVELSDFYICCIFNETLVLRHSCHKFQICDKRPLCLAKKSLFKQHVVKYFYYLFL